MKTKLHFFFLFYIISTSLLFSQTKKAKYSVVFTSVWNSTDHGILEKRSHWSKLVGATHKTEYTFWSLGEKATTGVKDIAEKEIILYSILKLQLLFLILKQNNILMEIV